MKTFKKISLFVALVLFGLTSCKKETVAPNPGNTTSKNGNSFAVRMTDGPGDFYALNVEIKSIDVFLENSGWINLSNKTQYVSVLDLTNGVETTLAQDNQLEVGLYSKLRIEFGDENYLTVNGSVAAGGAEASGNAMVKLKWNSPKAIEIDINETVAYNTHHEVLLDFQVAQSIQQHLQDYYIQPVITVIKDKTTGVKGKVEGAAHASVIITNGKNTLSTAIDAQGQFLIRGLEEGIYNVVVVPESGTVAPELPQEHQINGVVITQGEIKQLSTIQF